jgi:hypothetical protein
VGASLWALGTALVGAIVAVAALIAVANDSPTWYPLSMLVTGGIGLTGTIGGLRLADIAWLRWKLLGIGSAAIIVAGLLTITALTGTG